MPCNPHPHPLPRIASSLAAYSSASDAAAVYLLTAIQELRLLKAIHRFNELDYRREEEEEGHAEDADEEREQHPTVATVISLQDAACRRFISPP
ncbi:hypothetical protein EPR50_G00166380 [Perca flavescens]|uniref:Uncharacterized protein n=1 Tax=Perca flavescens TaxID=8167 RepID=A0A484CCL9_PERFV|nr:hypothetical protein EPR50_G00166380 [Perca flavescens]